MLVIELEKEGPLMEPFDLEDYRIEVRYLAIDALGYHNGYYKSEDEAWKKTSLRSEKVLVLTKDGKKFYPLGCLEKGGRY
ncbi:MAG: hypothetical protein NTV48_03600 [Candidatus Vogelbacteria bacterium]|nr:hypothetical protein [Candidatus Vogelbacteria bacterium]